MQKSKHTTSESAGTSRLPADSCERYPKVGRSSGLPHQKYQLSGCHLDIRAARVTTGTRVASRPVTTLGLLPVDQPRASPSASGHRDWVVGIERRSVRARAPPV